MDIIIGKEFGITTTGMEESFMKTVGITIVMLMNVPAEKVSTNKINLNQKQNEKVACHIIFTNLRFVAKLFCFSTWAPLA